MTSKSFLDVFQNYEKMIKNQIKTLNIYKNYDDYYQIGLIALWEAFEKYDERRGKFSAYAYVTVRGRMLEHLKKESAFENRHNCSFDEKVKANDYVYSEPFLEMDLFKSYLTPLTERQRRWVIEAIGNEKTIKEIAEKYAVSEEAVKSWRKAALRKLKQRAFSH